MATNMNYTNTEYAINSNLNVTLNRQSYGPLDTTTLFSSIDDFHYYLKKGWKLATAPESWGLDLDNVSTAVKTVEDGGDSTKLRIKAMYPYVGQIISVIQDGEIKVYVLTDEAGGYSEMGQQSTSGADMYWLKSDGTQC